MKSRNPRWNPEIRIENQKSMMKSRNPCWNPEIHVEIQKSMLKFRNPRWNPEIHKGTSEIRKSVWNPVDFEISYAEAGRVGPLGFRTLCFEVLEEPNDSKGVQDATRSIYCGGQCDGWLHCHHERKSRWLVVPLALYLITKTKRQNLWFHLRSLMLKLGETAAGPNFEIYGSLWLMMLLMNWPRQNLMPNQGGLSKQFVETITSLWR